VAHLLLLGGVLLLIGLLLSLGHAEFVETLVGAGFPQRLIGGELGLILGDLTWRFSLDHFTKRNDLLRRQLRGNVHLFLGGITLMRLGKLLGEEDQFGSVLLQTLNVLLKRLDALVTATVVDGDANGPGEVLVESGSLDLLEGETATEPLFLIVLDGWASDDRSELGGGSGRHLGGERLSGVLSADLPRRLVEPRLDAVLPILLEMRVLNHVVVFGSHFLKRTRRSSLL